MRVFLDANILFSAAKSDGAVRALVRLLVESAATSWADAYVVAEARRSLLAKGADALRARRPAAAPEAGGSRAGRPGGGRQLAWLPEGPAGARGGRLRTAMRLSPVTARTSAPATAGRSAASRSARRSLAERSWLKHNTSTLVQKSGTTATSCATTE
jgi:hypothetical protein